MNKYSFYFLNRPIKGLKIQTNAPTATPTIAVDTSVIQERVTNVTDTEIGYLDGVTSAIQTQIDTKAPLASPVLTGTPTAPTAAPGTNNTQIATTAYTDAAVAAIVDSAPATLNTLDELAAALGDDTNFATTTATAIGLKAPLASPTFTGTPTLPTGTIATTQTSGNNTTAVATTAFVATAVSSLPRGVVAYVREESGSMSLNSMFGGIIVLNGTTTTFTPVAGRLYRCSYSIGSITQPASPGALIVTLNKSGGSNMDTSNLYESTTNIVSHTRVITLTSSQLGTSPTNLSLSVQTDTSVTVTPSSVRPTIIIVEDIGLA